MMQKRTPTIAGALAFGFKAFLNNPILLLGASLTVWGVMVSGFLAALMIISVDLFRVIVVQQPGIDFLYSNFYATLSAKTVLLSTLCLIVTYLATSALYLGALRICLDIVDTGASTYNRILSESHLTARYIIASVIYGIAMMIGYALLIIPGLYILLIWYFFAQVLVAEQCGAFDSLRRSNAITEGRRMHVAGYILVVMVITGFAYSLTVVGTIIVSPIIWLATTYYYRALTQKADVMTEGYH